MRARWRDQGAWQRLTLAAYGDCFTLTAHTGGCLRADPSDPFATCAPLPPGTPLSCTGRKPLSNALTVTTLPLFLCRGGPSASQLFRFVPSGGEYRLKSRAGGLLVVSDGVGVSEEETVEGR